jgi:disulfide bond formation protein DsbB
MYPLVVVGGVAIVESRPGVWRTVLPLSLGGTTVAAYHVALQVMPTRAGSCGIGESCAAIQYPMLGGLLTIPRLSLVAFLGVSVGALLLAVTDRRAFAGATAPWG